MIKKNISIDTIKEINHLTALLTMMVSVCLSITSCLSVTCWYWAKTNKIL